MRTVLYTAHTAHIQHTEHITHAVHTAQHTQHIQHTAHIQCTHSVHTSGSQRTHCVVLRDVYCMVVLNAVATPTSRSQVTHKSLTSHTSHSSHSHMSLTSHTSHSQVTYKSLTSPVTLCAVMLDVLCTVCVLRIVCYVRNVLCDVRACDVCDINKIQI